MVIGLKKKALIHIAKKDLHLEDDAYRKILKAVAGVGSATGLTRDSFQKVMKHFHEMGFRGIIPNLYHPTQKGRFIPSEDPLTQDSMTTNQREFISFLIGELNWNEISYKTFCQRVIKKSEPLNKREAQKIIIGLLAILRRRFLSSRRKNL